MTWELHNDTDLDNYDFCMLNFGILGINARNLLYIKKFNPKKGIRLANNKLETKLFLSERWIPVPETYWFIKNRKQLNDFNFSYLPKNNFVVKPNEGSKGRGVLILEILLFVPQDKSNGGTDKLKDEKMESNIFQRAKSKVNTVIDRIFNFWLKNSANHSFSYKSNWNVIGDYDLKRYLLDILDGKYSMSSGPDKVLIEEKLLPWEWFKNYCKYWLADIRVIVFNLVPVVAMIRVPTEKSWWKANLNAGWIWFGINVSNGRIFSMTHKWKILKSNFPWEYEEFYNKKMPFWDDILFLSSKIQFFVNIWYLALDWVITQDGPKLLEINARAWLEVQNVTSTKLLRILDKISDLKVIDPEKWVEIAKTLFTHETTNFVQNSKVLYLSQYWNLKFLFENDEKKYPVITQVKLNKDSNYISCDLFDEMKKLWKSKINLELIDQDFIIKNISFLVSKNLKRDKIIIWKELASEFYIKTVDKTIHIADIINPSKILDTERDKLHQIDKRIHKIWNQLILSSILRPTNYFDELDNFITWNGKYNPKFKYNWPLNEKMERFKMDLLKIKDELNSNSIKSQIKKLFDEKVDELFLRLNLIKAYKKKNYKDVMLYNEKIFGSIDKKLLEISRDRVFKNNENSEILGRNLNQSEIKDIIKKHLAERWISGIEIVFTSTNLARILVSSWKKIKIKISKQALFKENEILSVLVHEIDTHLLRSMNWKKSWWHIFKDWTWYYVKDEEWLSVYNSEKFLPEGYDKITMYKNYFLIQEACRSDFIRLSDFVNMLYKDLTMEWLFKKTLRFKRWILDTATMQWWVFFKDKIYLDWYVKVKKYIENWWDIDKMYKGKVKIEDLDFID